VVTEGILTRRLQDDPALEGVGLLIFDEFHDLLIARKSLVSCQEL
jgi:ATP-dependent helicase HrpB